MSQKDYKVADITLPIGDVKKLLLLKQKCQA